jgi:hypothetical protein
MQPVRAQKGARVVQLLVEHLFAPSACRQPSLQTGAKMVFFPTQAPAFLSLRAFVIFLSFLSDSSSSTGLARLFLG